jgi:hypothetical protein
MAFSSNFGMETTPAVQNVQTSDMTSDGHDRPRQTELKPRGTDSLALIRGTHLALLPLLATMLAPRVARETRVSVPFPPGCCMGDGGHCGSPLVSGERVDGGQG